MPSNSCSTRKSATFFPFAAVARMSASVERCTKKKTLRNHVLRHSSKRWFDKWQIDYRINFVSPFSAFTKKGGFRMNSKHRTALALVASALTLFLSGCSSLCSTCAPAPVENRSPQATAPVPIPDSGNGATSNRSKCSSDIKQGTTAETLGKVWTLSSPLPSEFTESDRRNIVSVLGLPSAALPTLFEKNGQFVVVSAMPKYWDSGNECRVFRAERGTIPQRKNWKTDRIEPESVVVRSVCKLRLQAPNPMYGSCS